MLKNISIIIKKLMNLHHTNAYVKDFCISIKYIFINCIFIYYNYQAMRPYD
jgi:hypothetical protein